MLPRPSSAVPDLTRPKNEVVFWLAVVGAGAQKLTEIIEEGWDPASTGTWVGLGMVLLGIGQRWYAYGRETVAEIEDERDLYLAAARGQKNL